MPVGVRDGHDDVRDDDGLLAVADAIVRRLLHGEAASIHGRGAEGRHHAVVLFLHRRAGGSCVLAYDSGERLVPLHD